MRKLYILCRQYKFPISVKRKIAPADSFPKIFGRLDKVSEIRKIKNEKNPYSVMDPLFVTEPYIRSNTNGGFFYKCIVHSAQCIGKTGKDFYK